MMEGIEILSQTQCHVFDVVAFIAIVFLCIIIGLIIDLIADVSEAGFVGIILGAFSGFLIYFIIFEVAFPEEYTKYKVTISEEVSMTEFYEKYEIIDVDGVIYTIREKKDVD